MPYSHTPCQHPQHPELAFSKNAFKYADMLIYFSARPFLALGLLGKEAQGLAEAFAPGTFMVGAAGDPADCEFAVEPPPFGLEESGELFMVGCVTFVEPIIPIVEEHAGICGQGGHAREGEEFTGFVGEAFREVLERGREAGEASKHARVVDRGEEGVEGAEGGSNEGSGFGCRLQVVAFFEEGEQFGDKKLRVTCSAAFGGEFDVPLGFPGCGFSLRVVHGGDDAGREGAFCTEQANPFIQRKVDAREACLRIKNIGSVACNNQRVFFSAVVVAMGQPDREGAFTPEHRRENRLGNQPSGMTVAPVGNRMRKQHIRDHFMRIVGHSAPRGIALFRLPRRSAKNFVSQLGTMGSPDLAHMKRRLPLQLERIGGIPMAKRRMVSADSDGLLWPVDGRENLKTHNIHTVNLSPQSPRCTENPL